MLSAHGLLTPAILPGLRSGILIDEFVISLLGKALTRKEKYFLMFFIYISAVKNIFKIYEVVFGIICGRD